MKKIGCACIAGFGLLVMIGSACAPDAPVSPVYPVTPPRPTPAITTFAPTSTPEPTPEPTQEQAVVAPADDPSINIPNPDLPGHAPRIHVHVGRHHW